MQRQGWRLKNLAMIGAQKLIFFNIEIFAKIKDILTNEHKK